MGSDYLPFLVIPFLIYTYFWINTESLATFLEGLYQYLIEIYLGFKEWKIEVQTRLAYISYRRKSKRLARQNGFPDHVVTLYFEDYGEDDWRLLRDIYKERHEQKYKGLEEDLREMILY